jgi:penicillin-insensitive murein endopeptidase
MSASMMLFRSFVRQALPVALLALLAGCAPASLTAPPAQKAGAALPDGGLGIAPSAEAGAEGGADALAAAPSTETAGEVEMADDKEEIDDGAESPALLEGMKGQIIKHPLDGWTKQQIDAELAKNPDALGSMSIGFTNAGALFNGVQMPPGDGWEVVDPDHAWGTKETVDYLSHCINKIGEQFAGTAKMYIGHISAHRGGHLSPHVSHQAGRDVDVSYYYLPGQARWYATARENNLDRQRTWAFIRALVTDTDVELILMDRSIQRLVRDWAVTHGEDRAWVDQLFDGGGGMPPLIRHAKGHATHIHVRFYNPLAQETGRRAYDLLLKRRIIQPPSVYVHHKVKEGESLGLLAKKYGVSSKAIQLANGMKTTLLRASSECKIPQRGGVKACPKVVIPLRRTPPERTAAG